MDNFNAPINNQTDNSQPVLEKARQFISGHKIVFAILGLIILAEVIYAVRTLTLPTPPPPAPKASVQSTAAKISLSAAKENFVVGEAVPVLVMIDTGGSKVSGADLIVSFDPKLLEATSGGVIAGTIFDEYPLKSVDKAKGIIAISGISSLGNSFIGRGLFATLNLRAKEAGVTSLGIDFTKGQTSESNLVENTTSEDILKSVDNLKINIQ